MADEKDLEVDSNGGKKKKMMIIIIAVVVLLAGGGAAFFFMGGSDAPTDEEMAAALDSGNGDAAEGGEGETEASGAQAGTALYVPMPRPFRFNVPGSARDRFVEIRVQLLVRGNDNEEEAKKHVPLIESTLLSVFSISNADDLATSAGKASLKQKSLAEVQKAMTDVTGSKIIEKVLFTGFVMQ
ncbi:flagellar basal body-associated protein FliL [Thalassotalea sp. M1531]|uniref:Flagellar protein FliL n=1 Tax=Thalassotalea algicola TaxID=2716224 RepID=A0A7Y0LEU6_9GAMM|nr:flagellar basal body-associated protein FliL [Thalassotalea algicola]NMP32917.1 flagellar basal body-associated protein FliL [Thalassotalea algicola]